MRLQARKQAKKLQKPGRPSVLQTLANSASKARARQESVQLEYENWYTAPHSCELQLVQKPAGTSEREKSLVRVTISQSTSANAPLAQRADPEAQLALRQQRPKTTSKRQ